MKKQSLTLMVGAVVFATNPAFGMNDDEGQRFAKTPPYIILDDPNEKNVQILKTPADALTFPLSEKDQEDIQTLINKYDQEEKCVGLAAPQIGISKRFIFINIPEITNLNKWRPDLTDTLERTILINPSYEPLEEEKNIAYEACFSVQNSAGQVARYKAIRYSAWTPEGTQIKGEARGFLARILQHEIDHLNGQCFVDLVEGKLVSMEDYIKMRQAKLSGDEK